MQENNEDCYDTMRSSIEKNNKGANNVLTKLIMVGNDDWDFTKSCVKNTDTQFMMDVKDKNVTIYYKDDEDIETFLFTPDNRLMEWRIHETYSEVKDYLCEL